MTTRSRLLAAASVLALAAGPAMAAKAPSDVPARLKALEDALTLQQAQMARQQQLIEAQQAEIQRLKAEVGETAAAAASQAPVAQAVQTQQAQIATLETSAEQQKIADREKPRVSYPAGRPTLTSPDGRYSIALRGLVQMDAGHYAQAPQGPPATDFRRGSVGAAANRDTNAAGDLSDGGNFRRARLGVEGTFNRDWGYRFVTEFAGSGTEGPARINDAWISYTGFAPFTVQAGAFSPSANMDDGTAPDDTLFAERASASELSRTLGGADGRLGLAIKAATPRWMGSVTFTTRTVNDAEVNDSQAAVVARAAHLLFTSDDVNIHVGANGTWVFSAADQGLPTAPRYPIRLRERPEFRLDSTRLIDTGAIDAAHAYAAGLELGAQYRNLYLQAETFWFGVQRRAPTALSDPRFFGFYLQGSWVITGESHRYNMATGSFQSPRPYAPLTRSGGLGAWELAVRYSSIDLNYDAGLPLAAAPADGVRGGEQHIWSVGLNWYPNTNLRVMLDYLHIDVNRLNPAGPGNLTPFGAAPATPPIGVQIGQTANVVALRTQLGF